MIIELPEEYFYKSKPATIESEKGKGSIQTNEVYEYVQDGILYIEKLNSFRALMYAITLTLYPTRKCYYCNNMLNEEDVTLDHLYPVSTGGISIPENLRISCNDCNTHKGDLTEMEYMKYLEIEKNGEKKETRKFRKRKELEKEKLKYTKGFDMPQEWITLFSIKHITGKAAKTVDNDIEDKIERYHFIEEFIEKYGHFPNPIIVDKNYVMLNGRLCYQFALEHNISELPAVVLENVIYLGETV